MPLLTLLAVPPVMSGGTVPYTKYIIWTIDRTLVGASTLTNFAFPIYFAPNEVPELKSIGHGGNMQSTSGFDALAWNSSLSTQWNFKLKFYDPTTGELLLWVQVPSTNGTGAGSNTQLAISWGDSSITTDQSTTATWDSSIYATVETLNNETGSLDLTDELGITAATNHGATGTAGLVTGGAASLVQASAQYIDSGGADNAIHTRSISVKATSFPNAYNAVYSRYTGGGPPTHFASLFVKSDGTLAVYYGTSNGSVFYDGTGSHTLSTGTWYRLAVAYNYAASHYEKAYVNGVLDATGADNGFTTADDSPNTGPTLLGKDDFDPSNRLWDGLLAIFIEYKDVRSADWLFAEYNSLHNQSTFATHGSVFTVSGALSVSPLAAITNWIAKSPAVTLGNVTVNPTPATHPWTTKSPAISMSLTVSVFSAVSTWTAKNPSLSLGGISRSPSPAINTWTAVNPTISATLTLTTTAAHSTWTAKGPALTLGNVTVTPTHALFSWTAKSPTVTLGAISRSTTASISNWVAKSPAVSVGNVTVAPSPAESNWTVKSPSISGAVTVSPAPAISNWTAKDMVLTAGFVITPAPAISTWVAKNPIAANITLAMAAVMTWVILSPTVSTTGVVGATVGQLWPLWG